MRLHKDINPIMKPKDVDYHHLAECVGAQVKVKIPLLLVLWIAKKKKISWNQSMDLELPICVVCTQIPNKNRTLFRLYKNPPNFEKNDPSQIPSAYEEYSELISREKLVLWNEPCEKQSGSGAGQSTMLRFVHFCPVWSPQLNN